MELEQNTIWTLQVFSFDRPLTRLYWGTLFWNDSALWLVTRLPAVHSVLVSMAMVKHSKSYQSTGTAEVHHPSVFAFTVFVPRCVSVCAHACVSVIVPLCAFIKLILHEGPDDNWTNPQLSPDTLKRTRIQTHKVLWSVRLGSSAWRGTETIFGWLV